MEKKTKYKLKYVQNHILKSRIIKPSRTGKQKKLKSQNNSSLKSSLILLKYFNPIRFHRVVGDLVFLDHISDNPSEFIGLCSLWSPFKAVKDIKVSQNFVLGTFEDSDIYNQIDLLVHRLKTMGNADSYELALAIEKYGDFFNKLSFARKNSNFDDAPVVKKENLWQREFDLCLHNHQNEPIMIYHYYLNNNGFYKRTKIGINSILRQMTFQDDIKIFEESVFVVPAGQYYKYMRNHLSSCFNTENKVVTMYMNTRIGVKTIYTICHLFSTGSEKMIVLTFPKNLQTEDVKNLFEETLGQLGKGPLMPQKPKEEKNCKNYVYRNLETWDQLMKKYFEPWIVNTESFPEKFKIKIENSDTYLKLLGSSHQNFDNLNSDFRL